MFFILNYARRFWRFRAPGTIHFQPTLTLFQRLLREVSVRSGSLQIGHRLPWEPLPTPLRCRERAGCPVCVLHFGFIVWLLTLAFLLRLLTGPSQACCFLLRPHCFSTAGRLPFVPPRSREGGVSASPLSRLGLPCPSCVPLRPQWGAVVFVSAGFLPSLSVCPPLGLCPSVPLCLPLPPSVTLSCPTLCDPMDCSPPGSSVHGILQARILDWAVISSSRGPNRLRNRTCISGLVRQIPYHRAAWEAPVLHLVLLSLSLLLCHSVSVALSLCLSLPLPPH